MTEFTFADRYAEAGLAPSAQVITSRQAPAERIVADIRDTHILDLAGVYYSSPNLDLTWLRDEFIKEDASFSLVNNERETRVLAATMLGTLVANENPTAILAVIVGRVAGHRAPSQSEWLLRDTMESLDRLAVKERRPARIEPKVTPTVVTKLTEEIAAIPANDWAVLLTVLGKIRSEMQASTKTIAAQSTSALSAIDCQVRLLREEAQMLWWLFSGHSKSLERTFAGFTPQQAALVGAVDLGTLTTVSKLGPIAAPAMLERVIALAKRPKIQQPRELGLVVDGLTTAELERLEIFPRVLPARLAPVTAAIDLARTMGVGVWHMRFSEMTGLDASTSFDPIHLAEQLYREHLLGRLL